MPPFARFAVAIALTTTCATVLYAATNRVQIKESSAQTCITSNSIPVDLR